MLPPPTQHNHHRFREQGLVDLLESVQGMAGPLFLTNVREAIDTASSWQQVEGALFCLKGVAARLRRLGPGGLPSSDSSSSSRDAASAQQLQERAQQEQQLLLALFEELCNPTSRAASFLNNAFVCATASSLVGAYAPWFDNTPRSPLEGALQLLLHSLRFADSWHAAAVAFRALTVRCATRLANAQVLQSLAAAAATAITPPPQAGQMPCVVQMPLDDRQAVLEGLVRIVTLLPRSEAQECALGLQQPLLARTQAILTHGSSLAAQGGPAAKQLLQHLAQELQLMAVLVRGMEFPGPPVAAAAPGSMHPAMKLLEAAWPALTAMGEARVCQQDAAVVQALCEIYKVREETCGPRRGVLRLGLGLKLEQANVRDSSAQRGCPCLSAARVRCCLCVLCAEGGADGARGRQAAAGHAAQGSGRPVCCHPAVSLARPAGHHHRSVWGGPGRSRAGGRTAAGAGR
jgi:hypothetical protein